MSSNEWVAPDGEIFSAPVHEVTYQGNLLIWKVKAYHPSKRPRSKRGTVRGFSRASRFRLIKLLATIDWAIAEPCLFITLTYPDEERPDKAVKMNEQRSRFWRSIEQWHGSHIPGIWRMEWKPRKSGSLVGQWFPHFHVMAFKLDFVPHEIVNAYWRSAIGYEHYVRTETKRMTCPKQAGSYVAKYCAKSDDLSLVNASYLSIPGGRQWGVFRRKELPLCPKVTTHLLKSEDTDAARNYVKEKFPDLIQSDYESFTIIGGSATYIACVMLGLCVDHEV